MFSPPRLVSFSFLDAFERSPSIVIRGGGDAPTSEDCPGLDKHFLARRKDVAVGDHQIFCDRSLRYNNDELAADPDGV